MNQRPPQRPPAPPPLPDLSTYRPYEERAGGPVPPVEGRFRPPLEAPRRRPGRGAPMRRKRSWLRIVGWMLGSIGLLAGTAIALLVTFAPVGLIRDQLVREVKARTGRDLAITGRTSLSVLPSLGISMGDVALSAPPGMGGAPLIRMRRLEADVALMPLLSRNVVIDRLVLSEPVIELRVDGRGRRSWDFAELAAPPTIMVAQAPQRGGAGQGGPQPLPPELQEFLKNASQPERSAPAAGTAGRRGQPLKDIALGDIRIDNGTIRFSDERTGLAEEVRAINARLAGKTLASPVTAKGDLALRGERIEFDGRLTTPQALIEDRPVRIALSLGSPRASGRYDGALAIVNNIPQLDGKLKLDTRSLRGLAGWLGANLAAGPGLGAFALEGDIKNGLTWVALADAKVRLDEISATGTLNADLVGGRPSIKANLRLGAVDLNPYVLPTESGAPLPGPSPTGGTQVRGFTQRTGWSEVPIDLSLLGLADADVRLSMASVAYRDVKVGATQLGIALKGQALRANINDVRLYGGQGRGIVTLEPTGKTAAVAVNLTLDGVAGLPLLKDVAGFDWVDGKAKVQITAGGNGGTQKAIMEGLNGKAELGFADGAIVGFNLPQMIRSLSQGRVPGFQRTPSERTEFSEAGASFLIRNGVAETKDLRATSPHLRLTGAGTIGLGQRQVDMTLRPRLAGAQPGAAPAGELTGLELPVRIRGPWEKPQLAADMDSLLKNPNQAIDALREIGRQIQQGKGGGNLNQLIEQLRRR